MEDNAVSQLDVVALASLISQVPVPMWIFDQENLDFLEVNQAAIERYGFSREEFLAMTSLDIRPSEDIPRLLHAILRHPRANIRPALWRHQTKDGNIFPVEITSRQIRFRSHPAELVCAACPYVEQELIAAEKIWERLDHLAKDDPGVMKCPPCSTGAVRALQPSQPEERRDIKESIS